MRRIAGECTYVDGRGAVGIRLEPAAAIDENQDGTRGSNLLCSSAESATNRAYAGTAHCQTVQSRHEEADMRLEQLDNRQPVPLMALICGPEQRPAVPSGRNVNQITHEIAEPRFNREALRHGDDRITTVARIND